MEVTASTTKATLITTGKVPQATTTTKTKASKRTTIKTTISKTTVPWILQGMALNSKTSSNKTRAHSSTGSIVRGAVWKIARTWNSEVGTTLSRWTTTNLDTRAKRKASSSTTKRNKNPICSHNSINNLAIQPKTTKMHRWVTHRWARKTSKKATTTSHFKTQTNTNTTAGKLKVSTTLLTNTSTLACMPKTTKWSSHYSHSLSRSAHLKTMTPGW